MLTLHAHQERGNNEVAEATQYFTDILRQLPTGGGKTVEFSCIAKRYIERNPGKSVLILVHREELQQQSRRTLWQSFNLSAQLISSGMKYIPPASVYVGMVESTHTRSHLINNIGLLIIDECHEEIFTKVRNQYRTGPENTYKAGDPLILGFSATPLSSDRSKPLNRLYQTIIPGPQVNELIQLGRLYPLQGLCQNITRAPKDVVDRLSLTVRGGEFDNFNMGESFRKPRYVHNTVKAYKDFSEGKKAIVFNVNVLHSQTVAEEFFKAGYPCKHVDGKTPKGKRDPKTGQYPEGSRGYIFDWFKNTEGAILCNCDIARMGFDEPSVECVIVNLSTMSLVKWLQMCGRGGRRYMYLDEKGVLHDYKTHFDIIDMGGNTVTHLDWNYDRDWKEIFNNPPKPSKGGGVSPIKICPNEECCAAVHAATRVCPICGHVFPEKEISVEADLQEFIIMTKGIDIAEIIKMGEKNNYAEYSPLFIIGRTLARVAGSTTKEMTDEKAKYIWVEYERKGKEWFELNNIKRSMQGKTKRVFTSTMKERCKEILFVELKNIFPTWKKTDYPTQTEIFNTITSLSGLPTNTTEKPKIQNIENLKIQHYEF